MTRASEPGHSFTKMPILLRDAESFVVIPKRRQLSHVYDHFADDATMQYYEDRIYDRAEAEKAHNERRIHDLCTHNNVPRRFHPALDLDYKFKKYKGEVGDELKPVRHNIAVRSFFDRHREAADNDAAKRIGSGNVACLNFIGGKVTSRRPRTRFYDNDKIKREVDVLSRYGGVRDDLDLLRFKEMRLQQMPGMPGVYKLTQNADRPPRMRKAVSEDPELARYARSSAPVSGGLTNGRAASPPPAPVQEEPEEEAEPEPEPEREPEPVKEPTPEPKEPTPEPEPVKEPSPEPEPEKEPTPEPEPVKEPTPEPEPVKEPTPELEPVKEPTPEPEPVKEPTPEPEPVKEPTPEPEPVKEPTPEPEPVKEASPEPELVKEASPEPEPVKEASPEPEPEREASPEPEPEPEPEEEQPEPIVEEPGEEIKVQVQYEEFVQSGTAADEDGEDDQDGIVVEQADTVGEAAPGEGEPRSEASDSQAKVSQMKGSLADMVAKSPSPAPPSDAADAADVPETSPAPEDAASDLAEEEVTQEEETEEETEEEDTE